MIKVLDLLLKLQNGLLLSLLSVARLVCKYLCVALLVKIVGLFTVTAFNPKQLKVLLSYCGLLSVLNIIVNELFNLYILPITSFSMWDNVENVHVCQFLVIFFCPG